MLPRESVTSPGGNFFCRNAVTRLTSARWWHAARLSAAVALCLFIVGRVDVIGLSNLKLKGQPGYTYLNATLHGNSDRIRMSFGAQGSRARRIGGSAVAFGARAMLE